MEIGFKVATAITEEGDILQKTFTDQMELISTQLYRLREEQVRKALIELGWTPPKEDK